MTASDTTLPILLVLRFARLTAFLIMDTTCQTGKLPA
jgi:hypothetical protein